MTGDKSIMTDKNSVEVLIMDNGHKHEKLLKAFDYHGTMVELVEWKESVWCGNVDMLLII